MEKEVFAIFGGKIWKVVSKEEMMNHYEIERAKSKIIKREQLMMVWHSKERESQTERNKNTKPDCAFMEAYRNGLSTIGTPMLQLSHGPMCEH